MTNYYDLFIVSRITTFFDLFKVSKMATMCFDLIKVSKMTNYYDLFKVSKMTNYYDLFQAVSNKAIQSTLSLKKVKIESKDTDSYLLEKSSSK